MNIAENYKLQENMEPFLRRLCAFKTCPHTKFGLLQLCFVWCVLWEYYGLSFVWAFYRSVINLSLVCVTILAVLVVGLVLALEELFPSEQACFVS